MLRFGCLSSQIHAYICVCVRGLSCSPSCSPCPWTLVSRGCSFLEIICEVPQGPMSQSPQKKTRTDWVFIAYCWWRLGIESFVICDSTLLEEKDINALHLFMLTNAAACKKLASIKLFFIFIFFFSTVRNIIIANLAHICRVDSNQHQTRMFFAQTKLERHACRLLPEKEGGEQAVPGWALKQPSVSVAPLALPLLTCLSLCHCNWHSNHNNSSPLWGVGTWTREISSRMSIGE